MKLYAHIYKNHDGKYTQEPYMNLLYTSKNAANSSRKDLAKKTKKNLKLVKLNWERYNKYDAKIFF